MNNDGVEAELASASTVPLQSAWATTLRDLRKERRSFTLRGDPVRVLRAIAGNVFASVAPTSYVRLTGQTGRGAATTEGADDIAQYFRDSVDDYFDCLGLRGDQVNDFLAGKVLMEYGPGDLPGVAALMIAKGARKVYCVDRFPMMKLSTKNAHVIANLIDHCEGDERERLLACLVDPADPARGFSRHLIDYLVRRDGLSGLKSEVDFVYSRAVLEHVNDLDATFRDMVEAMRPGAVAIHQVDLRSHGLHKANPLDFLAWSPRLWNAMYSHKGVPNRWRADRYRDLLSRLPVQVTRFDPTHLAESDDVRAVRPLLSEPFTEVRDDDLRWLGIWLSMLRC